MSLPPDVVEAFKALGSAQRGKPEAAMLKVQFAMGGGVLNPVVEHLGDVTHRMSHMVGYGSVLGYEKVVKVYKWLTNAYGFEREMQQNIKANADYRKVEPQELANQVRELLRKYAEAHAELPVYNKAQWMARQAAIFVGLEDFDRARNCLRTLLQMCPNEEAFAEAALEFERSPDGSLKQYKP